MSPIGQFKRLDPMDKSVIRISAIAVAALIAVVLMAGVVVAVVLSYGSNGTSHKASTAASLANQNAINAVKTAQADCQTWHDLSLIIPAQGASPSGLQLYSDFRKSYLNKGCIALLGKLPPADPRVAPLVPPEVR